MKNPSANPCTIFDHLDISLNRHYHSNIRNMLKKAKILIVEDEVIIAKSLEKMLKGLEYAVPAIVASGEDAIRLVDETRPDLVLMDIRLRGKVDGVEAAERIRTFMDIPVVYLTAHSDPETLTRAKITRPFGYLLKPVQRGDLYITIEMALHRFALEKKLKASEQRWRDFIAQADDLIYTIDGTGRITSVNRTFIETSGYSEEELLGKSPLELVDPENLSSTAAMLKDVLNGVKIEVIEVAMLTKGGRKVFLEIRGHNTYDEDGKVVESFHIARNVTERKRAEKALEASREHYRSLFEGVPMGLYRTTAEGKILDANMTLVEMLGYPDRETFLVSSALDLYVNPEDRERENARLESEGVVHGFEIQLRKHDGTVIWVEDTVQAVKDDEGRIVCYEGSLVEITERKQAEPALARRVRELAALYDTSLEINAQTDLSSLLPAIVERAATLVGVPKGALYLIKPDDNVLELVVGLNFEGDHVGQRLELGEGLSGKIAQTGEPMMIEIYSRWKGRASLFEDEDIGRVLGVPLKIGDRVIGVINVTDDKNPGPFSQDDIRLVSMFADQAAIAVENVHLYEAAQDELVERKRAEEAERSQRVLTEALRDTAAVLNSTLDIDEVLDRILSNVRRVVEYDHITIMLIETGVAHIVRALGYAEGRMEEAIRALKLTVSDTPNLLRMAETGQPLAIPDTNEYDGWIHLPETLWMRSYAAAPILVEGQTVGYINLDSETPGFFNSAHAKRLKAFADQAAVALKNARLFEDLERYAHHMVQLNEITRSAVSAPDLQSMLQTLADRLGEMFTADHAHITLWDEENKLTIPMASFGSARETYPTLEIEPGELSLTESVIQAGRPLVIHGVESPYSSPRIASIFPAHSRLALPLVANGRKLGAVIIRFEQPHDFTQEEITLGEQVAGQVALAISRLQSLEAERQRTTQLSRANSLIIALGQVASRIDTAPDPDGVMITLGEELKKLGVQCVIALKESDSRDLFVQYVSLGSKSLSMFETLLGTQLRSFRLKPEGFLYYKEVIENKRPVFTFDPMDTVPLAFPDVSPSLIKRGAKLAKVNKDTKAVYLPLISEERVLGTMWMWGNNLEESDLPAASIFASQVAVALENTRLHNITQQLAITDELTGFYNRRGVFEIGRREVERSLRFGHQLSAVMADIDHFKQVNDTYGHDIGDEVLRILGERWRATVRGLDIIGRYGGEEFLVLLPESDLSTAHQVAERLRKSLVEIPISTPAGDVSITVSLGVAAVTKNTKNLEELIKVTDQALYLAKSSGRDRVALCK